eukprot:scaffold16768_cov117-Isochrysis_galbana.AAC.7
MEGTLNPNCLTVSCRGDRLPCPPLCREAVHPARKRNLLYITPVVPEKPLMSSRESVSYLRRLPRSRKPLSEISSSCSSARSRAASFCLHASSSPARCSPKDA